MSSSTTRSTESARRSPISSLSSRTPISFRRPQGTRRLRRRCRPEQRRRLITNGTLNADGTINAGTAHRLGWDRRPGWTGASIYERASATAAQAAAASGAHDEVGIGSPLCVRPDSFDSNLHRVSKRVSVYFTGLRLLLDERACISQGAFASNDSDSRHFTQGGRMTRSRFCCTFAAWIACATSAQAAPLFTERVSVNPTTGALADAPEPPGGHLGRRLRGRV